MTASKPFPRTHRLGGRGTFLPIREKGARVSSGPLVAWFVPSTRKHSRLGISIGRMVGNAAVRNFIKRQVREAFRNSPPMTPMDLVVQIRKHERADGSGYRGWWEQLLTRMAERS